MDFPDVKGKHPAYLSNEDYVGEFARRRKKFPLYFPTGTKSRYTNTNYLLLALIVERVSHQSFGAFMKSEFFDPLGMKSATVYENPRVKPKEPALGYTEDKGVFREAWGPPPFRHETLLTVGDGAVWASLNDMAKWDEGWRKGKVLKPQTIKKALSSFEVRQGSNDRLRLRLGCDHEKRQTGEPGAQRRMGRLPHLCGAQHRGQPNARDTQQRRRSRYRRGH